MHKKVGRLSIAFAVLALSGALSASCGRLNTGSDNLDAGQQPFDDFLVSSDLIESSDEPVAQASNSPGLTGVDSAGGNTSVGGGDADSSADDGIDAGDGTGGEVVSSESDALGDAMSDIEEMDSSLIVDEKEADSDANNPEGKTLTPEERLRRLGVRAERKKNVYVQCRKAAKDKAPVRWNKFRQCVQPRVSQVVDAIKRKRHRLAEARAGLRAELAVCSEKKAPNAFKRCVRNKRAESDNARVIVAMRKQIKAETLKVARRRNHCWTHVKGLRPLHNEFKQCRVAYRDSLIQIRESKKRLVALTYADRAALHQAEEEAAKQAQERARREAQQQNGGGGNNQEANKKKKN